MEFVFPLAILTAGAIGLEWATKRRTSNVASTTPDTVSAIPSASIDPDLIKYPQPSKPIPVNQPSFNHGQSGLVPTYANQRAQAMTQEDIIQQMNAGMPISVPMVNNRSFKTTLAALAAARARQQQSNTESLEKRLTVSAYRIDPENPVPKSAETALIQGKHGYKNYE
jgi:hypothetical protein